MSELLLSEKYKCFMKHRAPVEFLEGTTSAGKTTVGMVKWLLEVAKSPRKLHIISGLDLGTIEKNIIQSELGILDIFGDLVTYRSSGNKDHTLPHLLYHTSAGEKVIYVLGYDNKSRWKKALGGQYGCLYIDEINIADMEFVREVFMRADYVMATLNPDDPELPIYHEYINHARPLPEYAKDAPEEISEQLIEEPKRGWVHWFFDFDHNAGLSHEKKEKIISAVPMGTKLYQNKIQGIRGRAEGLIFSAFSYQNNVASRKEIKDKFEFVKFMCGVDTAYSTHSEDTIAFIFVGLTKQGHLVTLDEQVENNKGNKEPFAPSDVALKLYRFLEKNRKEWGLARGVYIDNADQGTLTELHKMKRQHSMSYQFISSDKSIQVIDRVNLQNGWLKDGYYIVASHCDHHLRELNTYSWVGDKPEDRNDHTINANQYAWAPLVMKIGQKQRSKAGDYDVLRKGLGY